MRVLFLLIAAMLLGGGVAKAANYLHIEVHPVGGNNGYYPGSSLPMSTDQVKKVNVIVTIMDDGDNNDPNDDSKDDSKSDAVTVKVVCGTKEEQKPPSNATQGGATFSDWVIPASDAANSWGTTGDLCEFRASATVGDTALTAKFPFVLGCDVPCLTARGGLIKSGQPFVLDNLDYDEPPNPRPNDYVDPNKLAFGEIRLENCTADSDPELFIATDSEVRRAYPVVTGSTEMHVVDRLREENGGGWGKVENMFFIGDGAGCNFTAYREAIIGGNNFTGNCSLNVAATAAVTSSNDKIHVKLDTKPTDAKDVVSVYVTANGGFTWQAWAHSDAAAWGTTAQDSGIAANSDNTKNRVLVKVEHTDGSVCWNAINGA